jgi:hypothetical protein
LDWQWNYWLDGNTDALSRLGHWNIDLAEQWRRDADIIIVQPGYYNSDWQSFLSSDEYSEALRINEYLNCNPSSFLLVYGKR